MKKDENLEFTGERFTPECVREIWYEHYHRYAFAKRLVSNKVVLDAACGEGYGSYILADAAKHVTGIDIDDNSTNHATDRYQKQNLNYVNASCLDLPFEDHSFDVIVSFETLEHLAEQEQMLSEFNRVLKADGLLIISTPDKKHYSDETGFTNEFHVKELYKHEFKELLDRHWSKHQWFSQAMMFNSMIERQNSQENKYANDVLKNKQLITDKAMLTPMYYIVLASQKDYKPDELPDLHLFSDAEQSVYSHYNKTIKDFIYLAKQHNALVKKHENWLSKPILGKIIKFLDKRQ